MILLQEVVAQVPTTDPSIWSSLADNGLSFLLMGVAVWILWQRDKANAKKIDDYQAKLEKYVSEDRAEQLRALDHNTKALEENTRAFEELREVMKEITKKP